ncbi:HK97 family phage prohead protease [Alkalibacillus salilacus]|uniref:HK97 family phage prohead protease n=1 Tax=Alkalibacillus salilacus TaxID=284582 RepID=A0ABT9VDD1_9BACI|nr:HK97 family phage prohead protease [Alkalibacillus salilacus]MDQ0158967.1 HK97 family phage prohead protease [Alkalibacillus salilacus]
MTEQNPTNKLTRKDREFRHFAEFQIRVLEGESDEDEQLYVEGYAATFDEPTVLMTIGDTEFKEQIDDKAFEEADMSDVIFNYNHSGKVMARTRNKTLQLSVDDKGLYVRARLDGTSEGRNLYEEIQGGYIDRMSFAFTVAEASFDRDNHTRTIRKVKKLYDVSAVDIPAYDTTSLSARSYFEAEAEKEKKALDSAEKRKELKKDILKELAKQ